MAYKPMYPGLANSPETTLAAGINETAVTIPITDIDDVPTAPNVLMLGTGEETETVLYTGKAGNSITGCTRGFDGTTARAWDAGTPVARRPAAYDLEALQNNIIPANLDELTALSPDDRLPIYDDAAGVLKALDPVLLLQKSLPAGTFGDTLFHDGTAWVARSTAPIIGVEWDTTSASPTLTWIDELGNPITSLPPGFFDSLPAWGGRWRCVRDRATGQITFGSNARGDGLTLDGTAGDVLVREPAFWAKHEYDPDDAIVRWWVSQRPKTGFALHPYYYMRGGGLPAANMFCGAYEAYGYLDETFKLGSATGKIPVTGGVGYPGLPNGGRLTIDDAELYAQNAGMSGITSFWGDCARMLLMYIEFGTFDIQTALGKGIVDLPSGEGFAGKLTGADNIDSRLAENGTGVGSDINSKTPVTWRGIENPYGNVWKFIIGCNFKAGGIFRTIKRDGSGTLAGTMADGSYEEGSGVPQVNGYVSGLLEDELGGMAVMPSAANGSDSTYLCDYWYAPTGDRILLAGGLWSNGRAAGPGCRNASNAVSNSHRYCGARVEFRPPEGA